MGGRPWQAVDRFVCAVHPCGGEAVAGGAAFCVIIVGSLLFGKKLGDQPMAEPCIAAPVTDEEYAANGGSAFSIPGTLVLAGIFFISFALYYFINWKYLAETWGIG